MRTTTNYGFKLPAESDIIDVNVLDENFIAVDTALHGHSLELTPIEVYDTLELVSASGKAGFYHGSPTAVSLLSEVNTTWGAAQFGEKHGSYKTAAGTVNELYISLYARNGVLYWDEYYDNVELPDGYIYIGSSEVVQESDSTVCSFSYVNDDYGQPRELSLRETILHLMEQLRLLRKEQSNG